MFCIAATICVFLPLLEVSTRAGTLKKKSPEEEKNRKGSPADDKPSANELHHFVKKLQQITLLGGGDILSKFLVSSSYGLGARCFEDVLTKGDLVSKLQSCLEDRPGYTGV